MNRLNAILVVYYPAYAQAAVAAVRRLWRPHGRPLQLLVVNNSGQALPLPAGTEIIDGDNRWREFSGWQSGVDHLRAQGRLTDNAGLLLCNDTICHHNRFGPVTRHAFRRAIRQAAGRHQPMMVGERWGFDAGFRIDGYTAREWLSTWLLMLNPAAVRRLAPLAPPTLQASDSLAGYFEQLQADELVSLHIARWLGLAAGGNTRWYAAGASAQTPDPKAAAGKGLSILLEKRLSAQLQSAGVQLLDVFEKPWVRQLRRLEPRPRWQPR